VASGGDSEVLGGRLFGWTGRQLDRLMPYIVVLLVFPFSLVTSQRSPYVMVAGGGPIVSSALPGFAVAGVAALAAGLAAGPGRRRRAAAFLWPLVLVAVLGWYGLTMWAPVMAASYYAAVILRRRGSIAYVGSAVVLLVAPLVAGLAAAPEPSLRPTTVIAIAAAAVFVLLPFVAGLWVEARRQVLAGLRERAARLEREQLARAQQAKTEERERIAREMHDVLAHRVSLMVVHAGALEVNADDPGVREQAALIRGTGREALTELRQVLGVLRHGDAASLAPVPGLSDVDELIERARAAGLAISRRDEGTPGPVPATTGRAVYRVVQEALTNAARHATGAATAVTLRWTTGEVELTVESEPARPGGATMPGGGYGLVGLRERVELLDGRFDARPRLDGGFRVKAVLPIGGTG
jgi:signal transduction histidine kinase